MTQDKTVNFLASGVIRIPVFIEQMDPVQWLKTYESNLELINAKDEQKLNLISGYLSTHLLTSWYYMHDFVSWKQFKEKFIERFQISKPNLNVLMAQVLSVQRQEKESIRDYVDRFDNLAAKYERARRGQDGWNSINSLILKDTFIEGIRPQYLKIIVKQNIPKDLASAQSIAIKEGADDNVEPEDKVRRPRNTEGPSRTQHEHKFHHDGSTNAQEMKHQEMQKKVDDLSESLQKLTLLVERGQTHVKSACYNCQNYGHVAQNCPKDCKICKGQAGNHVFWECPRYEKKTNQNSYLILKSNKEDHDENYIVENYGVEKRKSHTDSDKDTRLSRSGKRVKAHDTIPPEMQARIQRKKEAAQKSQQADNTEISTGTKQKKEQRRVQSRRDAEKKAKAILTANVYTNSLEDLMAIPGVRSALFRMTKRTRGVQGSKVSDEKNAMEVYQIGNTNKARQLTNSDAQGIGAPRVEAIIQGEFLVDAIMDAGSHCCIISLSLAKELNLKIVRKVYSSGNRMADGNIVRPVGEVHDLLVVVQGVLVQINATVFEKPPYDLLLGSDCMRLLGVAADYSTGHFSIQTDQGLCPLQVSFDTMNLRRKRLELKEEKILPYEDDESSEEEDSGSDGYSTDESTDSIYESYLVVPCETTDQTYMVGSFTPEVEELANDLDSTPTSNEDKIKIIEDKVQECEGLNKTQKTQLMELLNGYLDVFGVDYNDLKQTNLVKLHIDTGDSQPILKKPNKFMSHSELENLKKELAKMLKTGQIVPTMYLPSKDGNSSFGWAFPVMYVGKKNSKEGRLVVQFQDLNAVTKKDPWPLPSITHLMESYQGSNFFTTLDLLKGFNQIMVDDETIPKLTMTTPWGCYSYRVMPFGIVNGPACFSRAIYLAMHEYIDKFVTTYIDDITIFSKDFDTHLSHIQKVLERIREVNMVVKPSKGIFASKEVEVLGFVVSKQGIRPSSANVEKIKDFPKPNNKTDIRAFSALAGFYRRHINCFSDIIAPLNDLLKKNAKFVWGPNQEQAFLTIKECIINAVQLKYPDPVAKYKLYSDASDLGIGGVLVQWDEECEEDRPICFLSRKLSPAEMKYPTVEKECLALVFLLSRLKRYILNKELEVFTDSTAVRYLFTKSDPSSRLQRWIVAVQEFNFKIFHLPGKRNVVADAMSRYPPQNLNVEDMISPDEYIFDNWFVDAVQDEYEDYLMKIYQTLLNQAKGILGHEERTVGQQYRLGENQKLYRKVGERYLLIPKLAERENTLRQVHDGHGHFGQEATWQRLYESFWWPNAYTQVKEFVRSCENCQIHAYLPPKLPADGTVPVQQLFERFAIDYVGPFPRSERKNKYIITAIEYHTGWPIAKAVKRADADTTINFLYEEIFCNFGPSKKILSDNGTHFVSEEVQKFADYVNVKHQFTAPYRPQTNGKVEHLNGTLVRGIKKMVENNSNNWDTYLPAMLYAYRTKIHKKLGISPFEALYGVPSRIPEQDPLQTLGLKLGLERMYFLLDRRLGDENRQAVKQMNYEDKTMKLEIGDQVLRVRPFKKNKLAANYQDRIYTVIGRFHKNTFVLMDDQGKKLKRAVNGNHLKRFFARKELAN